MDTLQEKDSHKYKILPIVVIAVFDTNKRVLLLKREKEDIFQGWWELPGGRVEFGERIAVAAQRELLEETGINSEPAFVTFLEHIGKEYNLGDHYHRIMFVFSSISSSQSIQLSNEHKEYQWLPMESLPENVIPFNREAISTCTHHK